MKSARANSRRQFLASAFLFARKAGWRQKHDEEIRSRLRRGEEDSLVNFVLYGVSFTTQPRVTADNSPELIAARIRDFVLALRNPGANERLLWLKRMFPHSTPGYVADNVSRYLAEQRQYRRILETAPASDPSIAQLYRSRGLSIDTNFRPNWAIERALMELKQPVRRAAIIGPGLDFTDKDQGFDYYPLQTLQPFCLADSLLRLGLARLPDLRITAFDVSSQTLDHIDRARHGQSYTIQLAIDKNRMWNPEALAYWRRLGDRIGTPVEPVKPPDQVGNVETRAVQVRPEILRTLDPEKLDIVTQRLHRQYDLIVETNVLVYYGDFERRLALQNVESMLSTGGIFLSNTPLQEGSTGNLHSAGETDVSYSNEPGDDDRIEIYSNARFGRAIAPQ